MMKTALSKRLLWLAMGALLTAVWTPAQDTASKGAAVYFQRCAGCHESGDDGIPPKTALNQVPSERILRALDFGKMMNIASPMNREDRQAVATYLGTNASAINYPASAYCSNRRVAVSDKPKHSWNGWSPGLYGQAPWRHPRFRSSGMSANRWGINPLRFGI